MVINDYRNTFHDMIQSSQKPFCVAVTGHCHLGDAEVVMFITQAFDHLLMHIQQEHQGDVVALSGLGAGADTIFAEAALNRGIALEVCIAAADVIENFAPGVERKQHMRLREQSRHVHTLPFVRRTNGAYMALGYWLVDTCDLLIAAWNGQPAGALGGTADVVAYARQQNRPVVHIHTIQKTTMMLL